jgi:hypothetical protein
LNVTTQKINVELLLSRKVYGLNNRPVGRIEEINADVLHGDCYVREFLVGSHAVLDRLAAVRIGHAILGLFGKLLKKHYAIPWDKLDLSNPKRPRLTCSVKELKGPAE